MTRLPIRLRLALAFAAAAAVLLTAVGAFGYARLSRGFSDDLDLQLRQQAQDLIDPVSSPGASLTRIAGTGFVERGESFAEVVTPAGRVVDATSTLHGQPLLTAEEATRAARGTTSYDRHRAPGLDEPARLLATPFTRSGRRLVLVVGDTRENGLEALRRVRTELLVGIPLLVVLTFAGAYAVVGAALRPVEVMRRRAAELTGEGPALSLPVPPGDDEIARLGVTLNQLLERVSSTLARERAFVANASHELRTPLALLQTELELAVRRPRPAGDLAAAIHSAREEVDRLQRLAEDLLLLAQAGDGEPTVHPETIELQPVLQEAASRFAHVLAESGREIDVGHGAGFVEADRRQLEQVVTNLLANAVDHGDGTVRLDTRASDGAVEIVVSDQGPGFGPDLLASARQRFTRSPSSGGAGLGLAIVDAVARAHGGHCGLRDLEPGAQVWISLPAAASCPVSA